MNKIFKLTSWLLVVMISLSLSLTSCKTDETSQGTITMPKPLDPSQPDPSAEVGQNYYEKLAGYWSQNPGKSLVIIEFKSDKTYTLYTCDGQKFISDPHNTNTPYTLTNNRVILATNSDGDSLDFEWTENDTIIRPGLLYVRTNPSDINQSCTP